MTTTEKFGFELPNQEEFYGIETFNRNFEKLDKVLVKKDDGTAGEPDDYATADKAGLVKPDNKTLDVDEGGTLSVNLDGETITLDQARNVIKLADTLKEKLGSALQPESIANNQITTEAGFALDARQANPNIDGSLAKQLSDLNGSLNNIFSSDALCMDAFSLQNSKGYYITGPQTKNIPDNTDYGFLFILAASSDLWRLLIYIPTSQVNIYTNFYNGYGDTTEGWSTWHKAELSSL